MLRGLNKSGSPVVVPPPPVDDSADGGVVTGFIIYGSGRPPLCRSGGGVIYRATDRVAPLDPIPCCCTAQCRARQSAEAVRRKRDGSWIQPRARAPGRGCIQEPRSRIASGLHWTAMDTGKKNAGHGVAVAALARSLALFLLLDIKTLIKATIRTYRPCLVDPKTIFFLKKISVILNYTAHV